MWPFSKKQSTEVQVAIGILAEIECTFKESKPVLVPAFPIVREKIEALILAQPDHFTRIIQNGIAPQKWIWSAISNIAGDLVECGEYCIYRGVLNPLGPGPGLLSLFDTATDQLVQLGDMMPEKGEQQKAVIRQNIAEVG